MDTSQTKPIKQRTLTHILTRHWNQTSPLLRKQLEKVLNTSKLSILLSSGTLQGARTFQPKYLSTTSSRNPITSCTCTSTWSHQNLYLQNKCTVGYVETKSWQCYCNARSSEHELASIKPSYVKVAASHPRTWLRASIISRHYLRQKLERSTTCTWSSITFKRISIKRLPLEMHGPDERVARTMQIA